MKVCIIRPSVIHKEMAFSHMPSPPLGPAYIAGVLKEAGHVVQAIDAAVEGFYDVEPFKFNTFIFGLNIENTIKLIKPDTEVICFSFMYTNSWYLDRELVMLAREKFPNATIIGGGEHASAVPEYCFKTAPGIDYIVLGEGEATIGELMECIEKKLPPDGISRIVFRNENGIKINNFDRRVKRVENIDEIPWPAWELFPLKKYFEYKVTYGVYRGNNLPILASRGCPYDCTFCSNLQMYGKKYNLRNVKDVVDEMEYYYKTYNVTSFDFFDLTAIISKTG
jgi:anaerobic magnesium-protoporphyrin IX monomethyl ester cyclase